jgi:hypothetical protein
VSTTRADGLTSEDVITGLQRRANVIGRLTGFRTLAQVRAAYPRGVDPRDAAWMWRRLLVAVGAAHRAGVIHGAVLPELLERLYGPRTFRPFAVPATTGRLRD